MGGASKKKKKDPEKQALKQARKAQKAEKSAAKRERKGRGAEDGDDEDDDDAVQDEEEDIDAVLAAVAREDAARTEVTLTHVGPPLSRCNCSLTASGREELWLFGGERRDGDACKVYGELCRWRVDKDEWTLVASPKAPPPRCSHCCVEVSAKLYVFGGEYATLTQFRHFNDLWCFDTKTNAWEQRLTKKKPSPRSGHRARAWRGQLLLFGGFFKNATGQDTWHNDVWLYAPARNEWTEVETSRAPGAVKPPPRSACVVAVSSEDKLLVWGGYSEIKCDNALKARGKTHTDAWQLDLADDSTRRWERVAVKGDAPSKRAGANAARSGQHDLYYVFGGVCDEDSDASNKAVESSEFFNDVFVLDVANLRWSKRLLALAADSKAPAPRICAAVAVDGRTLYVAGGSRDVRGDRERTFDDLWALDVQKRHWRCLVEPTAVSDDAVVVVDSSEEEDDDDESATSDDTASVGEEDEVKDEEKDEAKAVAPMAGEGLRDFFERTKEHWLAQPTALGDVSAKDAKRAAFRLASECFEEEHEERRRRSS